MTDQQVLDALKESFADVRMDRPLETVLARGRGHRRRRRATAGGALLLAAGLAMAVATGWGAAEQPLRSGAAPRDPHADWSVTIDEHGTITLKLRHLDDFADPYKLQRALRAVNAPAIVRTGNCTWPSPGRDYDGAGYSSDSEGGRTIRITPSKLPRGAFVVFAIQGQLAPPGTEREGSGVAIRSGVMAPGGTVTCKP